MKTREVEMVDDVQNEESEEEDDENADEDFNPDKADAEANDDNSSSSSDESDPDAAAKPAKKTAKKRKSQAAAADDGLDSGDEATIKERKRKKRRKDANTHDEEDEESAGEGGGGGGFIRTRAQRVAEKEERRNRKRGAREGAVTIDVDKIWAELSSIPVGRVAVAPPKADGEDGMEIDGEDHEADKENGEMITIQTWANFAGQLTSIEKQVPRNSKEAQEYLKKQAGAGTSKPTAKDGSNGPHRPLKRPSMFEPNPMGLVKGVAPEKLRSRAPTRMDIIMAAKRAEMEAAKSAGKLSTVQMSQYDWKKYVEKEGYQEELEKYKKSDARFLEREAFLDRAAGAREQAARDARLKL